MPDTTAPTLDESVRNAIDETKPPAAEEPTQVDAEVVTDKPVEDKKEEPQADDLGLTGDELVQARQLFAALKDPTKQGSVIEFLATQAGYSRVKTEAKAEEVKKDITAVLKESLGPDLEYLAEKLGPAIDKLVGDKLTENTKDIRQALDAQKEKEIEKESADAMKGLARDFYKKDEIPDDIATEMSKIMDDMPPSGKLSVSAYLANIHALAVARKGRVVSRDDNRLQNNRTDAVSRLASDGARQPVTGAESDKKMNINDAVALAIEQASKEHDKG